MIIKIRNKKVAGLPYLMRLVLKAVYEPENMSLEEETMMQHSLISWANKAIKYEGEQQIIDNMGWMLKKNEEGFFDKRKASFKEHGIDYKKFHRVPEAMVVTKEREAELNKIIQQDKNRVNFYTK